MTIFEKLSTLAEITDQEEMIKTPLFIPDRTFWKSVNSQIQKSAKNRGKSIVFSTHCRGLALRNSLGAFRHKQDSTLVAEQTAIFSACIFLRVNI